MLRANGMRLVPLAVGVLVIPGTLAGTAQAGSAVHRVSRPMPISPPAVSQPALASAVNQGISSSPFFRGVSCAGLGGCLASLMPAVTPSSQPGVAVRIAPGVACRAVHTIRSNVNLTSSLTGVAVTSPCNAWAVGYNNPSSASGDRTLIEHWDGRAWKQVPSPNALPSSISNDDLDGVAAPSVRNAWAVGSVDAFPSNGSFSEHTLIEHWNGTRWSRVPSPSPGRGENLNILDAVTATSGGGTWAVGAFTSDTDHTLILRWKRGRWTRLPSPTPPGASNLALTGVTSISSSDAWAVGHYDYFPGCPESPCPTRTLIEHWDGHQWAIVSSPDPAGHRLRSYNQLNAVAGSTSGVWAVGTYTRPGAGPRTLIEFWNGTTWAQVPSVNPPGRYPAVELSGVTVRPGGHAWAVGGYGAKPPFVPGRGHTLIEYWNGRRWSRVPSPSRRKPFFTAWTAVAATSAGTVMAAGTWVCDGSVQPIAARLVHGRWRFVPTPNVSNSKCPV